ncbi:MAG: hypothetical protein WA941_23405 [Nitrososphaeraceae archaeon]
MELSEVLRNSGLSANKVTQTKIKQRDKKPELTFSMVNQRLFNRVIECLISILDELDDEDQKTRPKTAA